MTIKEALDKIKSEPKWYLISDNKGTVKNLVNISKRIEDGTAKPSTIKEFFSYYGYDVVVKIEFEKNGKKDLAL